MRPIGVDNGTLMTLQSDSYGELRYGQEQVYHFAKGIVGLQSIRAYVLFPMEDTPFYILHALEEQISFILLPAEQVLADYGFEIDQEMADLLKVTRPEEVATMLIVNIVDNKPHVNLKAPVLLAPDHRTGGQFIIHDREYPLRYPLTKAEKEDDGC